jgi:hypothetical protein
LLLRWSLRILRYRLLLRLRINLMNTGQAERAGERGDRDVTAKHSPWRWRTEQS